MFGLTRPVNCGVPRGTRHPIPSTTYVGREKIGSPPVESFTEDVVRSLFRIDLTQNLGEG